MKVRNRKIRNIMIVLAATVLILTGCSGKDVTVDTDEIQNDVTPIATVKTDASGTDASQSSEKDNKDDKDKKDSKDNKEEGSIAFSKESGMYADAFELTIKADMGDTIYYTLDGSDPLTSETKVKYSAAINVVDRSKDANVLSVIDPTTYQMFFNSRDFKVPTNPVDKCTVIRAVAVNASGEKTASATKTYFVGQSAETYHNVAILSLTTDSGNFFDYETGIYMIGKTFNDWMLANPQEKVESTSPTNFNSRGKDWERPVHIDFFETDGSLALAQDCGVRIQGNYSRADVQKSLRFYADADYGKKKFAYNFLGDRNDKPTTSKSFILRTGANDSFYTKFKDGYLQDLVNDRDVGTLAGRPCILFLDGEYWGLYTLQEDYSDNYFEAEYGVDKDEVVFYKNNEFDEGTDADLPLYQELISFAKTSDLSEAENYEEISNMLDIDSFIDYMSTEMYIINEDWPGHNTGLWRTRNVDESNPYADGRWRYVLYDTEMGVDHYGNKSTKYNIDNMEKMVTREGADPGILFQALIKNDEFKQKFVISFMDIANVNFEKEHAISLMEGYKALYYPELPRFFARYQTWANIDNATDGCIDKMVTFLNNRASFVPLMLKETLKLTGTAVPITIETSDPSGGEILLNTTKPDMSSGSFTGTYFTDYPITVTAVAADGYQFTGWEGYMSSTEATITVNFTEAIMLKAVFTAK